MTRKTNSYYQGDDIVAPVRLSTPQHGKLDRNDPQSLRIEADKMEAWLNEKAMYDAHWRNYQLGLMNRRLELREDLAKENNLNSAQAAVLFTIAWADGHDEGFNSVIDRFEALAETVQRVIELQDPS
jgi:plasmid replication initiation protein